MNREIKFRVRLYDGSILGYESTDSHGDWSSIDTDGTAFAGVFAAVGRMIREQYTGLKDKNGVEIYEGDVVRFIHQTLEHATAHSQEVQDKFMKEDIASVEWRDAMSVDGAYGGWHMGSGRGHIDWVRNHGEIIGSVYENPDLLN